MCSASLTRCGRDSAVGGTAVLLGGTCQSVGEVFGVRVRWFGDVLLYEVDCAVRDTESMRLLFKQSGCWWAGA